MTVEQKVKQFIADECYLDFVSDDDLLWEKLGVDSLRVCELVTMMEDVFKVEFEMSDLDPSGFRRVSDIVTLIKRYTERENDVV